MSGYFIIQLQALQLCLDSKPESAPFVRVDLSILNGFDVIQWSNNDSRAASPVFSSVEDQSQKVEDGEQSLKQDYTVDFGNLLFRSTALDLNNVVMNGLVGARVVMKVMKVKGGDDAAATAAAAAAAAAPAKGKAGKDAGVPPPAAEECLFEITLPLAALLVESSGTLLSSAALNTLVSSSFSSSSKTSVSATISPNQGSAANVVPERTCLRWAAIADDEMASYCLGAKIICWAAASMQSPPPSWGLLSPDVVDPKAKVPPTKEELRAKYLENIPKLVAGQAKIATYVVTIGCAPINTSLDGEGKTTAEGKGEGEGEGGEQEEVRENPIQDFFPVLEMRGGRVAFDSEAAAAVPLDEDIRSRGDLWRVTWPSSTSIFLHRSVALQLTSLIKKNPQLAVLPLEVRKIPTPEAAATEGAVISATSAVSIAVIVSPGCTSAPLPTQPLQGAGDAVFDLSYATNISFVPTPARVTTKAQTSSVTDVTSKTTVASLNTNRDIMNEMRDEISKTIERIGQEYVAMFGSPDEVGGGVRDSSEAKKTEFMAYMTTTGIFHELRVNLDVKLQVLVQDRFGARGRALGRSQVLKDVDLALAQQDQEISAEATTQALLDELYVFLMKECTLVLNKMFSDTLVSRDQDELLNVPEVNDEMETAQQQSASLLWQAVDATADERFATAEALHLERIQLASHSPALGSSFDTIHDVYGKFGQFLLVQLAAERRKAAGAKVSTMLLNRAREALLLSFNANNNDWEIGLLFACVLIESGQFSQSELVLNRVIEVQLAQDKAFSMRSFVEFDGYDTDRLCPIHPRCYAVLAALFSIQGYPLKARKALSLASRSFKEGEHHPPVSEHGTPRRTIVLALSECATYLFEFALGTLAHECVKLALDCDDAATKKATARMKPAGAVPHIRHALLRAQAQAGVCTDLSQLDPAAAVASKEAALQSAQLSCAAAEDVVDRVNAWITMFATQQHCQSASPEQVASLNSLISVAESLPTERLKSERLVPLATFVQGGKLLLSTGMFEDAVALLSYGCSVYSSGTLCLLLGVAFLRMEQLEQAEYAIAEANLLNPRNPEGWAYTSLLCLLTGRERLEEADECLRRALELDLTHSALLRELATLNMAIDRLPTAEDLIRRAIRYENRQNAHTKKLLADVMTSQSHAAVYE